MSRRIFSDVEEAISREVRRITFHNYRTIDKVVLQDTFDPFTGELVANPVEANFYDSSADTNLIQYPHFFVRLLRTREDIYTKRVIPQYGRWISTQVSTSPKAYEIIVSGSDGIITTPGNEITTSLFQIRKVQAGYLIRLLSGNNKGTYIVDSITVNNSGNHSIFVSSNLSINLPSSLFIAGTREVIFEEPVDLNTIEIGDIYTDASLATFNITAIDIENNSITIDGVATPDLNSGSKISRSGNIFQNSDLTTVRFLIMDPTKPVQALNLYGSEDSNSQRKGASPQIPIDAYYLVRIDSKERQTHVEILNRIWEEFNPPRTGLPTIVRSSLSAEQLLTADITSGGSQTVNVGDNSDFNINDPVFIFNDLMPSKDIDGTFERPFESKIIDKISTTQIVLQDTVPDTFKVSEGSKIVSNCEFILHMFHFVDHMTKDVEAAQYWVHEFTFWVQIWIDRLEEPKEYSVITDIATPIEDIESNIIIDDL